MSEVHERPCTGCGTDLVGTHCHTCGRRSQHSRITVRGTIRQILRSTVELDMPIVRTVVWLTRDPGRVCREYVGHGRAIYSNPFKYCLLTTAVLVLVIAIFEIDLQINITGSGSEASAELAEETREFVTEHFNVLMLLALPGLALVMRMLCFRSSYNIAEHYVFVLFVIGHTALVRAIVAPLGVLEHLPGRLGLYSFALLYLAWAARGFYRIGWWGALWRSLVANVLMAVLTALAGIATALVVVVLPAILSGRLSGE